MASKIPFSRSLLIAGWVLLMPPLPLGTTLPPLSEWRPVSGYKTGEDCDRALEALKAEARTTVTQDPNASALKVAAALGQLQAQCVETKESPPAAVE
jgi:hypothetical protein